MNPKFTLLDCDDDVILLEKDTFTVGRLKELSNQELRNKLTPSISSFRAIFLSGQDIRFSDIQFNSIKDCQLLKIGGKGWQKGKVKINICISTQGTNLDKVCLEFCSDEPIAQESPLDDLRKLV